MALVIRDTEQFVRVDTPSLLGSVEWHGIHEVGSIVPASGIYRCDGCGREIASNRDTQFPPQNHHQHPNSSPIQWRLVVKAEG